MSETYAFGDFRLDVAAGTLRFRGNDVKLTAKSIAVLAELARRAPAVVSRAEFEAAVWPEGYIEASNLTQTIYMVRTTLAKYDATPIIDTHNGHGYRLALPVERISVATPEARAPRSDVPAFNRVASSVVLGFGIACASAVFANHETPPATAAIHHTLARSTGGTLPLRATADKWP